MTLTHTQDFFERNDSSIRILGKIKITICQDFTAGCMQVAKIRGFLNFLLSHLVYCQIWLNLNVDDHQLGYITKLNKIIIIK
jgi:hypothetical protein